VAQVCPAIAGLTVYFKVWDVDDPFDQLHGPGSADEIVGVELVDDDQVGGDNRGGWTDPYTDSDQTDETGRAEITVTVSMQPGDNYRAGASLLEDAVDDEVDIPQATQAQADGYSSWDGGGGWFDPYGWWPHYSWDDYKCPLVWSQMLTVWRKLHVEVDSMARPGFAENTIETEWNQPRFPSGTLVLDIHDQHNSDHFENGFIRIKAEGFPDLVKRIITFRHSAGDDEIDTSVTEAEWGGRPTSGDHACIISDDDLSDESNFTAGLIGCDIGVGNPPTGYLELPDTSDLAEHYAPAYIFPLIEVDATSLGAFPFVKNMTPESSSAWEPARQVLRELPVSTSAYWSVYVLSAFQAERGEDYDGEDFATKGINTHELDDTVGKWGLSYSGLCALFLESLRECCMEQQQRITIAHEIAHTMGVGHADAGLMHETEQTNEFSGASLAELREYEEP